MPGATYYTLRRFPAAQLWCKGCSRSADRSAEIVDIRRGFCREQPRGRGGRHHAPALWLIGVLALALLREDVVLPVDDQHRVIAFQRVGVLALLFRTEDAADNLALHLVFAAGFP